MEFVDIGTVRVNYRFGGPVVARYQSAHIQAVTGGAKRKGSGLAGLA